MLPEPRRWQKQAAIAWHQHGRGVLSVVTGAGKTAFALQIFSGLRETRKELRLVVLVPTIALLDQWVVALTTDGDLDEREIATYSGEGHARRSKIANVLVLNTARDTSPALTEENPCLFVVDECHRAGSPENARALRGSPEFTLGLSATPVREFDDGFERYVAPALGPVIYEYGYAEARRDGVISPFTLRNYRFPLSSEERKEYESLERRISRMTQRPVRPINDPHLETLMMRRSRFLVKSPRRTVAAVAVAEALGGKQIVFHERIEQADRITELLNSRGIRAAVYHSKLGASFRRRNLELFKEGQFDVLVTCRALDEGLNVPDAGVAVIAASTSSTRQRIQRLGRVLRPTPGKKVADVATLFATNAEAEFLREEAASLSDVAETQWYDIEL